MIVDIPKVAIMMSTYNGEMYLREQLDSIFTQEGVSIKLFVRDDASSDGTIKILQDYSKKYDVEIIEGENVGAGKSFFKILYYVLECGQEFDFYAFSDQDDIWLPQKLLTAIQLIDSTTIPKLYCSNQILYINNVRDKMRFEVQPDMSFKAHLCKNEVSGCTMLFNNSLAKVVQKLDLPSDDWIDYRLHDTWMYLVAKIYGRVIYDHNSYILYRIHNNNTVGIRRLSFYKRVQRFFKASKPARCLRSKTASLLLKNCIISKEEQKEVLEEFAYYRSSIRNRMKLVRDKDIRNRSGEGAISLCIKVFTNLF